jgi:hypothetical protein
MGSQRRRLFITIAGVGLIIALVALIFGSLYSRGLVMDGVTDTSIAEAVPDTLTPEVAPGIVISGTVRDSDGVGLENVDIYLNYASYPGRLIERTDAAGNYESDFYPIPGDEMITVWAERSGLQFEPKYCFWRHYHGYEMRICDFLAQPIGKND